VLIAHHHFYVSLKVITAYFDASDSCMVVI